MTDTPSSWKDQAKAAYEAKVDNPTIRQNLLNWIKGLDAALDDAEFTFQVVPIAKEPYRVLVTNVRGIQWVWDAVFKLPRLLVVCPACQYPYYSHCLSLPRWSDLGEAILELEQKTRCEICGSLLDLDSPLLYSRGEKKGN